MPRRPTAIVLSGALVGCAGILDISETPAVDGGSSPTSSGLRVFVTSGRSGGNLRVLTTPLSGLNGADETCQAAARAAGLGVSWQAWLGVGGAPASGRITASGPWHLVDGKTVVFESRAALETAPSVPLDVDELGRKVPHDEPVWTGSNKTCGTCASWTSAATTGDVSTGGGTGLVGSTTATWTEAASCSPCNTQAHLYCFEH